MAGGITSAVAAQIASVTAALVLIDGTMTSAVAEQGTSVTVALTAPVDRTASPCSVRPLKTNKPSSVSDPNMCWPLLVIANQVTPSDAQVDFVPCYF